MRDGSCGGFWNSSTYQPSRSVFPWGCLPPRFIPYTGSFTDDESIPCDPVRFLSSYIFIRLYRQTPKHPSVNGTFPYEPPNPIYQPGATASRQIFATPLTMDISISFKRYVEIDMRNCDWWTLILDWWKLIFGTIRDFLTLAGKQKTPFNKFDFPQPLIN